MTLSNRYLPTLLTILIVLSSCATSPTGAATTPEPMRIGAIFILSGVGSNWGTGSQQGADLAIDTINAEGGIDGRMLEIIYEDNPSDEPVTAVTALHKLLAQDIDIVLGTTWSQSGVAVAPVACAEGALMISPSLGVAEFNEACDSIFNLWPHDALLSEHLGRRIFADGHRRLAILSSQQVWEDTQARAVQKGFKESGGTIVTFEAATIDQRDFRTELLRIKASQPDAIYLQYTAEDVAARQMRELGLSLPIYIALTDTERILGAQGALEGATVMTSFTPAEDFSLRYNNMYGVAADIGADTAYDAVMLLTDAMRTTHSTEVNDLKDYLGSLKVYSGASGNLTFDGRRGVTKPFKTLRIAGNTTVEIISHP